MIPQPLIAVRDVPATSAWYQRALGLSSAHGGPDYEQLVFEDRLPDLVAQGRCLNRLADVAHVCGRAKMAKLAVDEAAKLRKERSAQVAWHELLKRDFPPKGEVLDAYLTAHQGTRWAEAIAQSFD